MDGDHRCIIPASRVTASSETLVSDLLFPRTAFLRVAKQNTGTRSAALAKANQASYAPHRNVWFTLGSGRHGASLRAADSFQDPAPHPEIDARDPERHHSAKLENALRVVGKKQGFRLLAQF